MKTKIASVATAAVSFLAIVPKAFATSLLTVPTSTVPDLTANVSDTIADPGTLLILVAAIAFPLLFWVIGRIIGLFPKHRK